LLALVANANGEWERAATLCGTADSGYDSLQLRRWPTAQEQYESTVAQARTALGSETFETHYAAGQTMSEEQAIAYALGAGNPAETSCPIAVQSGYRPHASV
jgi:hypothetical protein